MSKIRNEFINLLESSPKQEGFKDFIKNLFVGKKTEPQSEPVINTTGEYPMTYKDAINNFENIAQSPDKVEYVKQFAAEMAKSLKDRVAKNDIKMDDVISDFGYISSLVAQLGQPEQQTEEVCDFNTISDTYRMQDMPQ